MSPPASDFCVHCLNRYDAGGATGFGRRCPACGAAGHADGWSCGCPACAARDRERSAAAAAERPPRARRKAGAGA